MGFPGQFGDHILPDQTYSINLSFIVQQFERRRGGTAGNVSYTLGLLATPHKLLCFVGKDIDPYKKDFKKLGIDTKGLFVDKATYTATGFDMTDKKENQIWGYFYGAMEKNHTIKLTKYATKNDFVLIGPQGAKNSISFVKQCIAAGIPYMFDPGFILTEVQNDDLLLGLTHATYIIGNEYEMKLITERISSWENIAKTKIVITTLGEKGALIVSPERTYTIPPVKVNNVVETTGAGDAWRGGFLAGLIRGLDLKTCGQMGAVAGAYAVEHYGTQEHMYTPAEFAKRYRQAYGSLLKL